MLSVVVIVGLAWAVFFGPSVLRTLRKEFDRFSGGSIGQFNKSLSAFNHSSAPHAQISQVGVVVRQDQNVYRSTASLNSTRTTASKTSNRPQSDRLNAFAQNRLILNREQMLERRRLVMLLLGTFCVLTGLLGMIGSLEALWILTFMSAVLIFSYVGAVKYTETLEAEKRRKLTPIQNKAAVNRAPKPVRNSTFGQGDSSVVILGKLSQK